MLLPLLLSPPQIHINEPLGEFLILSLKLRILFWGRAVIRFLFHNDGK
jgi:hypothetical protein